MKNLNTIYRIFFPISLILISSCSLKYDTTVYDESNIPEFIFEDAKYTRYKNYSTEMIMDATKLEQYHSGSIMYGKDVEFQTFDKTGKTETTGKCGLLSIDNDLDEYTLYDNIEIENINENLKISADSLRWNGKSEQLTSGRNDMVKIEQNDTVMYGSGFSASGVSKKYAFTGVVSGEIKQNKVQEEVENNEQQ
ncbi:MAG: LPS export ABC transporter periplasmic protein LptC [Treponema sp.]|nr:LPS export ABC transporter periplasmic protein LptC [Treponema sp.]